MGLDKYTSNSNKIEKLEKAVEQLQNIIPAVVQDTGKILAELEHQIRSHADFLSVLVKELGEEKILKGIDDIRLARTQETLSKKIADKEFVPVTDVREKTYLHCFERDDKGEPVGNGHLYCYTDSFVDDIKSLVIDKKVGDVVTMKNGGTLEIKEAYEVPVPSSNGQHPQTPPAEPPVDIEAELNKLANPNAN